MKRDFFSCLIDIRVIVDCKGIEVFGIVEGLNKCLLWFYEVINVVKKDFVLVDKFGMKKFFLGDKGLIFLKVVEDKNNCVIVIIECSEGEVVDDLEIKEEERWLIEEFVCSYLMKEGKIILVMKGDIMKDCVDVIVNVVNGDLRYIGGFVVVIVKVGGKMI